MQHFALFSKTVQVSEKSKYLPWPSKGACQLKDYDLWKEEKKTKTNEFIFKKMKRTPKWEFPWFMLLLRISNASYTPEHGDGLKYGIESHATLRNLNRTSLRTPESQSPHLPPLDDESDDSISVEHFMPASDSDVRLFSSKNIGRRHLRLRQPPRLLQ